MKFPWKFERVIYAMPPKARESIIVPYARSLLFLMLFFKDEAFFKKDASIGWIIILW